MDGEGSWKGEGEFKGGCKMWNLIHSNTYYYFLHGDQIYKLNISEFHNHDIEFRIYFVLHCLKLNKSNLKI